MCINKFDIIDFLLSSNIHAFGLWIDEVGHFVSLYLIQQIPYQSQIITFPNDFLKRPHNSVKEHCSSNLLVPSAHFFIALFDCTEQSDGEGVAANEGCCILRDHVIEYVLVR